LAREISKRFIISEKTGAKNKTPKNNGPHLIKNENNLDKDSLNIITVYNKNLNRRSNRVNTRY